MGLFFKTQHRLFFREVALAYSTDGAHPIIGNVFEGSARSNAAVGIAYFRVINVTTYVANILLHNRLNCCVRVNIKGLFSRF